MAGLAPILTSTPLVLYTLSLNDKSKLAALPWLLAIQTDTRFVGVSGGAYRFEAKPGITDGSLAAATFTPYGTVKLAKAADGTPEYLLTPNDGKGRNLSFWWKLAALFKGWMLGANAEKAWILAANSDAVDQYDNASEIVLRRVGHGQNQREAKARLNAVNALVKSFSVKRVTIPGPMPLQVARAAGLTTIADGPRSSRLDSLRGSL